MQLGRVVGTATATIKHPTFQGERMLVVQLETPTGGPTASRSWRSTGWGRAGATWCWSPTTAGRFRRCWGRPRRAAGA